MTSSEDSFYNSLEYKAKQSLITKKNWESGIYNNRIKALVSRPCKRPNCNNIFLVKPHDPKSFCSNSCSAKVSNQTRNLSELTKLKISAYMKNLPESKRQLYNLHHFRKQKVKIVCLNCKKSIKLVPYLAKTQKYCSIHCNIVRLGRKTTSPKASKGKNGVRLDIDPNINFYSTWEANVARVYNLVGLKWTYAPKLFDLGEHTYRPDFYLPDFDTYIEVKNYMSDYSSLRDKLFRKHFPSKKLDLILKDSYLQIKSNYKDLVEGWEN